MSVNKRRIDVVVRILVVVALIFGCFDSALLYSNWQKNKAASESETIDSSQIDLVGSANGDPAQMVTVNEELYEPVYEEATGMEYDDSPADIIPPIITDNDIHISAKVNPSVISLSDILHVSVEIFNNSPEVKKDLVYYDYLNNTLILSDENNSSVIFNNEDNVITYPIDELAVGEALIIEYDLKIDTEQVSVPDMPQTWLHSVYLKTGDDTNKNGYQADLVWMLDKSGQSNKSASILSTEGGWTHNNGISIYAPENSVSSDSVLIVDKKLIASDGPELQFGLDLFSLEDQSTEETNTNESQYMLQEEQQEAFSDPVYLQVDFDSLGNLADLPPGIDPYIATFDEEAKVWVKVPLDNLDYEQNTISAYASHFSVWGAGLGSSLPQNGANVLLFDQPYVSLFTGRASYNLPISAPAGRANFSPSVSLSYSSRTVDGVLGDIQAPWVGMGWNIDAIEVVRKITTDENGFGYDNDFALTINGTVYSLVEDPILKGRYHTEDASFYYIQRHNPALGNDDGVQNTTKEWWEVISPSGIHYRLGWTNDAEQLSMMPGYYCMNGYPCTSPLGAYTSLGYAGVGVDVVAMRWRVDQIWDTHNNYIQYNYQEESKNVGSIQFDHASYLANINYTGHLNNDGSYDTSVPTPYQIRFNLEDRPEIMGDNPSDRVYDWDNFENKRLDSIEIIYHCTPGSTCEDTRSGSAVSVSDVVLRTYDFAYDVHQIPSADGTQVLSTVNISAGGYTENGENIEYVSLPAVTFDYTDKANQAENNPLKEHYTYPRLTGVDNGFGAEMTFEYERDNRADTYWYNYRVKNVLVDNGFDDERKISYTYNGPVYIDNQKELLGFSYVDQFTYDFDQTTKLSFSRHNYSTTYPDFGKETQTIVYNPANNTQYLKSVNTWSGNNSGVPTGVNFRYISQVTNYQYNGTTPVQTGLSKFTYNPYTGNLTEKRTYKGDELYTIEHYEYGINTDAAVYITDRVLRSTLTDGNGVISADTRYMYDNSTSGVPTVGDVTLVQNITGINSSSTVDSGYVYDIYGNVIETINYAGYGTVGQIPTYNAASDQKNQVIYDATYHMLPVSSINPLGYTTTNQLLFSLGAAKSTTDANQESITYTYDGLGRQLTSTANGFGGYSESGYAGYTSKTIYPTNYQVDSVTGKNYHVLEMQIWDPVGENEQGVASPGYRSIWGIYDAQGVIRQTQMVLPDGSVQLVDVSVNAQGLTDKESEPHISSISPGSYAAIDWSATAHSTNTYDFMGRITHATAPDGRSSQYNYPFYAKETIDAAGHKKRYEYDYLDRLVKVLEYTGTGSNYELYSSMSYSYDVYSNLISVTDQEGSQTKLGYDWLGRKLFIKSPDMGFWSYDYNALGSLTRQNDARDETVCLYYDQLNRLTGKAYAQSGNCLSNPSSNDLAVSFGFGDGTAGKPYGYRTSMQDETGSTTWNYSNSARTITEHRQISGNNYQFTTYSDYLGRVFQENDPGEQVNYHYDITGRVVGMDAGQDQDLIQLAYNNFSQIENMTFQQSGNLVTRENTYNNSTHRLDEFKIYNGASWSDENALMNFSYQYDLLDNITSINDHELEDEYTFTYDDVNRLITAQSVHSGDYNYKQAYDYDATGNILSVSNWRYTYYPAGVYQDDFEGINFNENWSMQTNVSASDENEHISGIIDSELTFYFNGSGVGYVRRVGPDQGMVDVYIDGEAVEPIDNYAATESYQELAVISVEAGEHRLDLKVSDSQNVNSSGASVNLDYLEVYNDMPTLTPTPTLTWTPSVTSTPTFTVLAGGTYQENADVINFTGIWQNMAGEYYAENAQAVTNASGASFSFLFTGNHFDLIHSAGPDHGIAEVCFDAGSVVESCQTVDYYDANSLAQVTTGYEVPYGMHVIRVSHTGTQNENATDSFISIDQLNITSNTPTETPTASETATITLTPSETPIPSDTPIASETPVASETLVESNTPESSETLAQSETPQQTITPDTSETLEESSTPEFSATPSPTMDGSETFTYTPDGSETATEIPQYTETPTLEFSNTPDGETETPQALFTNTPSETYIPSITYSPTSIATITNTPVISNVALGKTVSQSSLYSVYPATLAIDGDYSNFTHTQQDPNEWWQIDLGGYYQINSINIWNRLTVPERLSNYYIIISNRPFANTTVEYGINQPDFTVLHMTSMAGRPSSIPVDTVGRYIRVQLAGTNHLSISEFEVFGYQMPGSYNPDTRPTNLALGKTVSQSSLYSVYPATLAIDRDYSNYTHTLQEPNEWWQVDLGALHQIDSINIWNRISVPERLSNYYVFISDTPFRNSDLEYTINDPGVSVIHMTTMAGRPSSIPIDTTGRYIRIQLAGTNHLSISEFEVFGEQLPDDVVITTKSVNLAYGASAFQSSQYSNYVAANAINGNTTDMTHTLITTDPWVEVDLNNYSSIEKIKLWNRDGSESRLTNYYVFVSVNPFTSNSIEETINQPGVWTYHDTGTALKPTIIDVDTHGKYVRIQLNGTNHLSVKEIIIEGYDLASTPTPTFTPSVTLTPSLTPTYDSTTVPTEESLAPRLVASGNKSQVETWGSQMSFSVPGGGDDRIMLVALRLTGAKNEARYMISGETGWLNLTHLKTITNSTGNTIGLYYTRNLPKTNNTMYVSASSHEYGTILMGAAVYDRVDSTAPFGRIQSTLGTNAPIHTDIYANADELAVGVAGVWYDRSEPISPASSQSIAWRQNYFAMGYQQGGVNMDWTSSDNIEWGQILVALKPNHTLEDTNSRFDYTGTWDTASNSSFSGGTEHMANALGEEVHFHFYGNQLKLYYAKDTNRGIAQVCIDEGTAAEICQNIDQYAASFAAKQATTFSLTQGGHNVVMRYTGTRNQDAGGYIVGVDKISVAEFLPTVTPTFTPTFTPTATPTLYSTVPIRTGYGDRTITEYEKPGVNYQIIVPPNGDNRLLLVHIAHSVTGTVNSMTYNGIAMTRLLVTSNAVAKSEIWYLKNPPSGVYYWLSINRKNQGDAFVNIISLSDVNMINTFGYVNGITGTGTVMQQSFSADANDYVMDMFNYRNSTNINIARTPGAGQTVLSGDLFQRRRNQAGFSVMQGATSMSWTWPSAVGWTHQVVVLHPMGYATPTPTLTPTSTLTLTSTPSLTPTPTPLDWPTPVVQTPQTAGVYQESDPAWHYTGFWDSVSNSADSGGARMEGTQSWASAQMSFTGNQLTYTFRKGPNYGIAELYVGPADGSSEPVKVASIDQYNATVLTAQTETITLPENTGDRILVIRHADRNNPDSSGYTINLDAVAIGTEAEITLAPTKSPTNIPATVTATVNPLGINLIRVGEFSGNVSQATNAYYVPEQGNNRILMIGLGFGGPGYSFADANDLLSITYAGQPLQLAAQTTNNNVTQMWYLTNPPVGWHDIVITFNETKFYRMGAATFNGVDQLEPIRNFSVNEQYGRRSFTAVNSPTGDVALSIFTGGTGDLERPAEAQIAGMVQIIENGDGNQLIMSTRTGAGYTYMEYSWDNGDRNNDLILVSLKKYTPSNVTSTPSVSPTPGDSPTVTPTSSTPTALPTSGMFTNNYHYDASQPHAVTGVDREFRQDKFTYDANGNQTTRLVDGVTYTLAYDEENRIETVTDTLASQTWTFHYDGNGTRVRQINPDGSQLLLLNGGRYHVEIAADTTVSTTRYYSIAGQRPAMRNNDGSINYLLGDHLGSVSTVVNASGEIVSQSRYLPFGEVLWEDGVSPTDYTYTGQRSLTDIGLMDYNARFYDPMLGRFTSPDSIVPDPGSVIGYNRFAYVNNNPMIYTDPSGHCINADGSIDWNFSNGPFGTSGLCNVDTSMVDPIMGNPVSSDITDPGGVASDAGWDTGPDAAHRGTRTVYLRAFYLTTCAWDTGCRIGWDPYYAGVDSERYDPTEGIIKLMPGEVDETIDMYKALSGNMLYMEPSGRKIGDNISDLFENDKPPLKFGFEIENGFPPGYEENVSTLYTPYVIIDNSNGEIIEYGIIEEPIKKIEGRFFFFDGSTLGGFIFPSAQDPAYIQSFSKMKGW